MKKIIVLLFLMTELLFNASAQDMFLRVYDMSGKKIGKGFYHGTTDSTLQLIKEGKSFDIPVYKIGNIKTKRSIGHTILAVGTVGVVVWTALFLSVGTDDFFEITTTDAILAGLIGGTATGVFLGGIAGALKKSKTITVDGSLQTWLMVRPVFDKMTVSEK